MTVLAGVHAHNHALASEFGVALPEAVSIIRDGDAIALTFPTGKGVLYHIFTSGDLIDWTLWLSVLGFVSTDSNMVTVRRDIRHVSDRDPAVTTFEFIFLGSFDWGW